jgi:putative PEP-CTERM system TPR-repeat lipoprotein
MKFKRNSTYEAAFVRVVDYDEASPEELARQKASRRRLTIVLASVFGLLILGGAGLAARAIMADTPEKQVRHGIALSKSNSHVAAIIEFKRSLQEEPDQPDVRVLLGKELSLLGDAKGAQLEFEKAVSARYHLDTTLPLLATSLLHQAKFDKVIALVNDTPIESASANAELLALRGSSYYALGRETEAETSWKAAQDFIPGHPQTLIAEARALASKNKFSEAIALLEGIAPGAPPVELWTLRGDLAKASGKLTEAVDDYQAALKVEPGNMLVRTNLAQTLVDLSRFDDAAVEISRVTGPMPNYPEGQFIAALVFIGQKDLVKASEAATRAVQLTPTDGRYELLAGTLALQLGQPATAEQYLAAAVTAMPRNIEARRLLTLIYVDKQETRKADELFRPVFASDRSDQQFATIAAHIAIQQGDTLKAAHAFDGVDPANPKNVDATLLGASLHMRVGDKAGGFAMLRAAAKANPDNPDVDSALVMSHLTFNEINEALVDWKVLADKQPQSARTYNLLAAIDLARKDKAAARHSMEQAAEADPRFLAPVSGLAMLDIGERKIDDAKARLRRFIAANPMDSEAPMLLVQVERSSGASRDAIGGILREAHKANPKSPQISYALALLALEHGDRNQALAIAEEGLVATPDDVPLMQLVGDQSLAAGDNDRAVAVFTRLMDRNAAAADYPMRLGLAQIKSGKYEEALTAFRLALSRQADNVDRQYAMIGALLAANRPEEAARMVFEIERLSPRSPALAELDADVKLGSKKYPEAISAYKRLLAQRPNARLVIKTTNALLAAKQRGEANNVVADWLKAHPADEGVRRFEVDLAMRFQEYGRAIADLRVLVAAHPDDPQLLNTLAWNLGRVNDPQAIAVAEKATRLAPDNAAINDTLGWMMVEKGDAGGGLPFIEKANRSAPNALDIKLHLGQAQLKVGRNVAARETLQSVATAAPNSEPGKASQALLATF